jgi:gamma-glutamylcyclotransferase (GGCT)/AIG2-like uncharacterized protein YtfP
MENKNCIKLFVYGSLRSGFRNPEFDYMSKFFTLSGEAVVKGSVFSNQQIPVAVPSENENYISGELYVADNVEEFNWCILQLDDYEGLNVEQGQQPLYKRELVNVYQNGEATTAWIYWYNKSTDGMPEIKTGEIMKYLQEKNKPQ